MRCVRLVAIACALLVPAAAVADELIRFSLSSSAAACCARMHGACAGLSSPDTCCQTREQAAGQPFNPTPPVLRFALASPVADVLVPLSLWAFDRPSLPSPVRFDLFKRPHDPPHLRALTLRI